MTILRFGNGVAYENFLVGRTSQLSPGEPTSLVATNTTNIAFGSAPSASVAFSAPASNGGSAITSYTVTSSPGGVTASGSSSPITVTGLTAGTSYTYRATAANAIGTSNPSTASSAVTASTKPQAPTIGTAASVNSTTASVAFTSNQTGGSAITSYTVTSNTGGFSATGSSSPITVTGAFGGGSSYTFSVTATNANGASAASSASNSVTFASVPGAPTGLTATNTPSGRGFNDGAASIQFNAPASNGGSAITRYTVTSSGNHVATGSSSPITVTGLSSSTGYSFTVKATNAIGTGPDSGSFGAVSVTTAPQNPGVSPTPTVLSSTSVSINITAPPDGGSTITGYTITSSPSIALSYTATSAGTKTVTGSFAANTAYTFRVTATNANGESAGSGTFAVTPYIPPPPVYATISGLTYTKTGETTGVLSWSGTNIDVYRFTGNSTNYPAPYNYGTYTGSWPGNLVNMLGGQSYTVTIDVRSYNNGGGSQTITFTHPYF
jgi:hypothetical protein